MTSKRPGCLGRILGLWKGSLGSWILLFLFTFLSFSRIPVLVKSERYFQDRRMAERPPREPEAPLTLAVVDEKSLSEVGRWPWPRSTLGELVQALDQAGAAAIAFDMAFVDEDLHSGVSLARSFEARMAEVGVEDPRLLEAIQDWEHRADPDTQMAEAIEAAQAAVMLGYFFYPDKASVPLGFGTTEVQRAIELVSASKLRPVYLSDQVVTPPVLQAYAPQTAIPVLARSTQSHGSLNAIPHQDGVVRSGLLVAASQGVYLPSAGLELAWLLAGKPKRRLLVSELGVEGVQFGKREIPTNERGEIRLDYLGPPGRFPQVSISDVLGGRVDPAKIKDRGILIGSLAKGIGKEFPTPVSSEHPGIELTATMVDNLLTGRGFTLTFFDHALGHLYLFGLGAFLILVLHRVGLWTGVLVSLAAAGFAWQFAAWMFHSQNSIWLVSAPLVWIAILQTQVFLARSLAEEAKRREVQGAFGQYVSPDVVSRILEDPDNLRLGGEERVISVLFSDLKGFTAASEKLGPKKVVELMSEYFEEMTAKVYEQEGLLKEYVGDEIMAIYGAPMVQEDHAKRACRAALAMNRRLHEMSEQWQSEGRPPLAARWGVNSGPMLVGNLGSSYRFSYGAIGDNVNLGSRLEGLNNQYGTEVLIGEGTYELLDACYLVREVDSVRVKGKQKAVRVFELVDIQDAPIEKPEWIQVYEQGLSAFRQRDFEKAKEHFQKMRRLRPEDGPSQVLLERCEDYLASPPPEDWDGTYTATKK